MEALIPKGMCLEVENWEVISLHEVMRVGLQVQISMSAQEEEEIRAHFLQPDEFTVGR